MYHFRNVQKNEGAAPALHPTLVALFIVLQDGADLSEIRRGHPDLCKHKYYKPEAKFPQDISKLLPAPEHHWWETLGKSCAPFSRLFSLSCTAADACQRKTAPVVTPCLPRVRLLLPDQAAVDKDVQMDVDQLEGDGYVPVSDCVSFSFIFPHCFYKLPGPELPSFKPRKAARKAPESRKRKGSTSLPGPSTVKCQASSSQQQEVPDDAFEVSNYRFSLLAVTQTG